MDYSSVFLSALLKALNNIPHRYFKCSNANREYAKYAQHLINYRKAKELVFNHGERAFCYELYHCLRGLLDIEQQAISDKNQWLILQGELKKEALQELAQEHFGAKPLDKKFIPDFLLHVPGNFDQQEVVMEVKTDPTVNINAIKKDIEKIEQFILRYHYKYGVFLVTNNLPEKIVKIIRNGYKDKEIAAAESIEIVIIEDADCKPFHDRLINIIK